MRNIRRKLQDERKYIANAFKKEKRLNSIYARPGKYDFVIVLDHLKPSFNIGKIFRSADAFGVYEIHLVGIDFFNPLPAEGSFKWVPAVFHKTFADCYNELMLKGYSLFCLDPNGTMPVAETRFPLKSAFIFGHEEFGMSFEMDDYPRITPLVIPQFGRVKCLNVSIAASVVMYEYTRQRLDGIVTE